MKKIIIVLLVVSLLSIFGCTSNTTTSKKANINFKLGASFKKPQPSGKGDYKVQAIYVDGFQNTPEVWQAIEKYGKDLTWFNGDVNTIFFFNDQDHMPRAGITLAPDYNTTMRFSNKYNKYCVAGYWHYANGQEQFTKYPLKP